jgi:hypothetical protein
LDAQALQVPCFQEGPFLFRSGHVFALLLRFRPFPANSPKLTDTQ